MNYNNGGRLAACLCAALFAVFGLSYLMGFQAEYLQMAQHIWSDGQTEYMAFLEPVLITALLMALGMVANRVLRPWPTLMAMAYAPSFILMALLTAPTLPVPDGKSNGWSYTCFIVWVLLIGIAFWIMRNIVPSHNYNNRRASTSLTVLGNLMVMLILMTFTCMAANTRIHFHNTLAMSALAAEGKFGEALEVGSRNAECSRSMCAMRAYALSREGQLPEKLFAFPQHHGALGLIPPKADSSYVFNWPHELYRHLGCYCVEDVSHPDEAIYYLGKTLERHPGRVQADYLLCAYLLERRLDDFARELPKHYALNDSLPRHYKEALVVYQRRNQEPLTQYHDEQTEANFKGFQKLRLQFSDPKEQEFQLVDMYHETYWCYYYFASKQDK